MFSKKPTRSLEALFAVENYISKVAAQTRDPDIQHLTADELYGPIHLLVKTNVLMIKVLSPECAGDYNARRIDSRIVGLVTTLSKAELYNPTEDQSRRHIPVSESHEQMFGVYQSLKDWFETAHTQLSYDRRLQYMQAVARLMIDALNQMGSYRGAAHRTVLLKLWNELLTTLGAGFGHYVEVEEGHRLFGGAGGVMVGGQLVSPLSNLGALVEADIPTAIVTLCTTVMNDPVIVDKEEAIVQNLDQWITMRLVRSVTEIQASMEHHAAGEDQPRAEAKEVNPISQLRGLNEEAVGRDLSPGVEHGRAGRVMGVSSTAQGWMLERNAPSVNPPFKMGVGVERDLLEHLVTQVMRQAFRTCTNFGTLDKNEFEPDRFINRALLGLFGPYTATGESNLSPTEAAAPSADSLVSAALEEVEPPLSLEEQREKYRQQLERDNPDTPLPVKEVGDLNELEQVAWQLFISWAGKGVGTSEGLDKIRDEFIALAKRQWFGWNLKAYTLIPEDLEFYHELFVVSLAGQAMEAKRLYVRKRQDGNATLSDALRCQRPLDRVQAKALWDSFSDLVVRGLEQHTGQSVAINNNYSHWRVNFLIDILHIYSRRAGNINIDGLKAVIAPLHRLVQERPEEFEALNMLDEVDRLLAEWAIQSSQKVEPLTPAENVDFIRGAAQEIERMLGWDTARKNEELADLVSDYDNRIRENLMVAIDTVGDRVREIHEPQNQKGYEVAEALIVGAAIRAIEKVSAEDPRQPADPLEYEHLLLSLFEHNRLCDILIDEEVDTKEAVSDCWEMVHSRVHDLFRAEWASGNEQVIGDLAWAVHLNVLRHSRVDFDAMFDHLSHQLGHNNVDPAEDSWLIAEQAVIEGVKAANSQQPDNKPGDGEAFSQALDEVIQEDTQEQEEPDVLAEEEELPDADEQVAEEGQEGEEPADRPTADDVSEEPEVEPTPPMDFSYIEDEGKSVSNIELNVVTVVPYNEIEVESPTDVEVVLDAIVGFELINNAGEVLVQVHVTDENGRDLVEARPTQDGFILSMTPNATWMNVSEDLREVTRINLYSAE